MLGLCFIFFCVDSPPEHLDIFKGAPLRLPKPFSDQFPVRVLVSPLYYKPSVNGYLYMHVCACMHLELLRYDLKASYLITSFITAHESAQEVFNVQYITLEYILFNACMY